MKKIRLFTSLILVTILILSITIALPVTVGAETEAREPYGLNYLKIIDRVVSNDGQWKYIHYKDKFWDKDVYSPGEYLGLEEDVVLPTEIDGHQMTVFGIVAGNAVNISVPKSYIYLRNISGDLVETITFSREYKENEIIDVSVFNLNYLPLLKKIILPNLYPTYKKGKNEVIYDCAELKSFGNQGFFEGDTNLTEIVFPDNLTDIGTDCFKNCTSLRSLVLPSSMQSFHSDTGCKLETIYSHNYYTSDCNVLIVDEYTEEIREGHEYSITHYPKYTPELIVLNPAESIIGDINGDNEFNINDVTMLQQILSEQIDLDYLFKNTSIDIAEKGDYNKDGKTTAKDALCMQLALAGRYTPPLESGS